MLRVVVVCVSILAAGAAAGVRAQGEGNAQASKTPDTYDPTKTQVIEGCLKPTATAGLYQVENATLVKNGPSVGTSGSAPRSYTIVGVIPPSVKLKDHVGHKVQLSGNVTGDGKFGMSNFKMVSANCS